MFKFLKNKLKDTISRISDTISSEGEDAGAVEQGPEKEKKEESVKEEKPKKTEKKAVKETKQPEKKKTEKPAIKKEKIIEKSEPESIEEEKTEKAIKEEKPHIEKETPAEKPEEKKRFMSKLFKRKPEEKPSIEEQPKEKPAVEEEKPTIEEIPQEQPEEIAKPEEPTEKPGIISKIKTAVKTKKISESQFDDIFWEMELTLLENNVAVEVIEKIKDDLKNSLIDRPLARGQIGSEIMATLKTSITEILDFEQIDLIKNIKTKKPYIICFVGINGSGKTTTIAKVAHMLKNQGISCCLAAADTFRAAAIDQLTIHADKLGIKIIKHDYGADPAAVAFDTVKHAEAKGVDVVLIDTAGRIHSNVNLQDEMKKIIRIAKPDMKIFVGESITGNDCVEQAKKFDESIDLDGIILSKADIDEKGGAALSVSYVTKKPILYIGTGQEYADIEKFEKDKIISNLGL